MLPISGNLERRGGRKTGLSECSTRTALTVLQRHGDCHHLRSRDCSHGHSGASEPSTEAAPAVAEGLGCQHRWVIGLGVVQCCAVEGTGMVKVLSPESPPTQQSRTGRTLTAMATCRDRNLPLLSGRRAESLCFSLWYVPLGCFYLTGQLNLTTTVLSLPLLRRRGEEESMLEGKKEKLTA